MMSAEERRPLDRIYDARFDDRSRAAKGRLWAEIVRWLEPFVDAAAPVLDVACDTGDFIANVTAVERWASDVRDVSASLPTGVRFVQASGLDLLDAVPANHFGTVFMSNYLEHLPESRSVIRQLEIARDLLRPSGRVVVLQPNIRYAGAAYWDFIDHHTPLTDRSLVEAGNVAGLTAIKVIPRFLPYTTQGRLPMHPWLVRAYLRVPLAWRVLGGQTLYVAERA